MREGARAWTSVTADVPACSERGCMTRLHGHVCLSVCLWSLSSLKGVPASPDAPFHPYTRVRMRLIPHDSRRRRPPNT